MVCNGCVAKHLRPRCVHLRSLGRSDKRIAVKIVTETACPALNILERGLKPRAHHKPQKVPRAFPPNSRPGRIVAGTLRWFDGVRGRNRCNRWRCVIPPGIIIIPGRIKRRIVTIKNGGRRTVDGLADLPIGVDVPPVDTTICQKVVVWCK